MNYYISNKMLTKTILVLGAQAFLIQTALSQQCISRAEIDASRFSSPYGMAAFSQASPAMAAPGLTYNGLAGRGLPCDKYSPAMEFAISSGGGLPVTSISSISPTGITVKSYNTYEGPVTIVGELPFVSAVAMEGNLPTTGAGAIEYGCGNGIVAMLSEGTTPKTFGSMVPGAPGPNMAFGVGSGFGSGPTVGLGNSFVPAAGFGAAGFANANRLGKGGCGCGRGMIY